MFSSFTAILQSLKKKKQTILGSAYLHKNFGINVNNNSNFFSPMNMECFFYLGFL